MKLATRPEDHLTVDQLEAYEETLREDFLAHVFTALPAEWADKRWFQVPERVLDAHQVAVYRVTMIPVDDEPRMAERVIAAERAHNPELEAVDLEVLFLPKK